MPRCTSARPGSAPTAALSTVSREERSRRSTRRLRAGFGSTTTSLAERVRVFAGSILLAAHCSGDDECPAIQRGLRLLATSPPSDVCGDKQGKPRRKQQRRVSRASGACVAMDRIGADSPRTPRRGRRLQPRRPTHRLVRARRFSSEVRVMRADGSHERRFPAGGQPVSAAYAPAGDRIAVTIVGGGVLVPLCREFYTMTPRASHRRRVTHNCEGGGFGCAVL